MATNHIDKARVFVNNDIQEESQLELPTSLPKFPLDYFPKCFQKAIIEIAKHIESSDEKLAPIIKVLEQAQAAQPQPPAGAPNPAPQAGGASQIFGLALQALGGGGGVDEEMRSLNKRIMEMSINRMQADIGFTEAIKNAVVTSIAGKAAKRIVE